MFDLCTPWASYRIQYIIISTVMAVFFILLGIVLIFMFRKKISMWLQHLQGPIGRFWRGGNRPPQQQHLNQPHYQDNRVQVQTMTYYNYSQDQQYPTTYAYPQYNQNYPQTYPVSNSQVSMDDEHRAQITMNPYQSRIQGSDNFAKQENQHGVNPYIR